MNDKEILQKALEKVASNGLKYIVQDCYRIDNPRELNNTLWWIFESQDQSIAVEEIIFSHDFAKTFWGERQLFNENIMDEVIFNDNPDYKEYVWQYHLQQMVLEKEPLKYIARFL